MSEKIFAATDIHIKYPYERSMEITMGMIKVWDIRFLSGGTNMPVIKSLIPINVFKRFFGSNPIKGKKYDAPVNSEKFIEFFEVTDILIKENQ